MSGNAPSAGVVEWTEAAAEDRAVRFVLDGLEVASLGELRRLVEVGRAIDGGRRDLFAGTRYAQYHPIPSSRIACVMVVAREGIAEVDEREAADLARMCIRRIVLDVAAEQ